MHPVQAHHHVRRRPLAVLWQTFWRHTGLTTTASLDGRTPPQMPETGYGDTTRTYWTNSRGHRTLLVELVAEQAKRSAIAIKFNDEGVPTASKGGKWHASTVAHVLRSVALDDELAKIR